MSSIFTFFSFFMKDSHPIDKDENIVKNSSFVENLIKENKLNDPNFLLEFIETTFNTFKQINKRLDELDDKIEKINNIVLDDREYIIDESNPVDINSVFM